MPPIFACSSLKLYLLDYSSENYLVYQRFGTESDVRHKIGSLESTKDEDDTGPTENAFKLRNALHNWRIQLTAYRILFSCVSPFANTFTFATTFTWFFFRQNGQDKNVFANLAKLIRHHCISTPFSRLPAARCAKKKEFTCYPMNINPWNSLRAELLSSKSNTASVYAGFTNVKNQLANWAGVFCSSSFYIVDIYYSQKELNWIISSTHRHTNSSIFFSAKSRWELQESDDELLAPHNSPWMKSQTVSAKFTKCN